MTKHLVCKIGICLVLLLLIVPIFCGCFGTHVHHYSIAAPTDRYLAVHATCIDPAAYYYSCACGERGSEMFTSGDALGHIFTNYVSDDNATCSSDCTQTATCERCCATDTKYIQGTTLDEHTYSTKWSFDRVCHWHAATCEHTDEVSDQAEHEFENDACKICGCENPASYTLRFKLNSDGKSYYVDGVADLNYTDVVIPSTYNNLPVTAIDDWAFSSFSNLTSIKIPNSVTSIGDRAFRGCENLTSIEIPDSVTSIDEYAFKDCTNLKNVTIGSNVKSVSYTVFYNCESLATIEVSEANPVYHSEGNCIIETASKTLTFGCKSSVIPDDGSVTSIGSGAFYECSGLTQITIPDSVTSICEYAFGECGKLVSVTLGSGVTSIESHAFENCYRLVEVINRSSCDGYIGNAIIVKEEGRSEVVNQNDYLFYTYDDTNYLIGYFGTESDLVLPDSYNGQDYVINRLAFCRNEDITSITIPDSVRSIGHRAFSGCSSLTSVTISDKVVNIEGDSFAGCRNLESIKVSANNPFYRSDGNCIIERGTGVLIAGCKSSVIPTDGSVTAIGSDAFRGCGLTSIEIPDSVTSIGSNAFHGCSLTSIEIPDSVTWIGSYAFYGCSHLTSIVIPNSITSIEEGVFSSCFSLTSVTIGDGVTSIGDSAFHNCNSLTNIDIPAGVTSIGWSAFRGCGNLTSVEIHSIGELSISSSAFERCPKLTSVTIGDGLTSMSSNAFIGCSSLIFNEYDNAKYLGDNANPYRVLVEVKSNEITDCVINQNCQLILSYAFYGCSALTSIEIPDSITFIDSYTFYGCSGLTSITIPSSVTAIGQLAFVYCDNLTNVYYKGDLAEWCAMSGQGSLMYDSRTLFINGTKIEGDLVIPYGVTSIGVGAFGGCTGLTSVEIPNSVTSIGDRAFYNCSGLTSISIPESVTSIGYYAFNGCNRLAYYKYDNAYYLGNKDNPYLVLITAKSYSITGCTINPNCQLIAGCAFEYCRNLTSIEIPASVTAIGYGAFSACARLVEVINNSSLDITKGSEDNGWVGYYAINVKNGGESEVVYQDGYWFYTYEGINYLFGYTGNDTQLILPENYNGSNYIIYEAFYYCNSLISVVIPDSVTAICDGAFLCCENLTSITIGKGVKSIGDKVFYFCNSLTTINYNGTKEEWDAISKSVLWEFGISDYTINYLGDD